MESWKSEKNLFFEKKSNITGNVFQSNFPFVRTLITMERLPYDHLGGIWPVQSKRVF